MILDHYLVVQEWEPNFDTRSNETTKLLVWVRFPSLSIEYFEDEFLMKIGRDIGRPIRIDNTTSLVSKGKFARMCIEVDITKPLVSKFLLNDKEWPIEYEGIHLVCFNCGKYGHRHELCRKDVLEPRHETEQQDNRKSPRMLVSRVNKRNHSRQPHTPFKDLAKKPQTNVIAKESPLTGTGMQSRFNPLYDLEAQDMDQEQGDPHIMAACNNRLKPFLELEHETKKVATNIRKNWHNPAKEHSPNLPIQPRPRKAHVGVTEVIMVGVAFLTG